MILHNTSPPSPPPHAHNILLMELPVTTTSPRDRPYSLVKKRKTPIKRPSLCASQRKQNPPHGQNRRASPPPHSRIISDFVSYPSPTPSFPSTLDHRGSPRRVQSGFGDSGVRGGPIPVQTKELRQTRPRPTPVQHRSGGARVGSGRRRVSEGTLPVDRAGRFAQEGVRAGGGGGGAARQHRGRGCF